MYTVHYTVYTVLFIIVHYTIINIHYTWYNMHCTLYSELIICPGADISGRIPYIIKLFTLRRVKRTSGFLLVQGLYYMCNCVFSNKRDYYKRLYYNEKISRLTHLTLCDYVMVCESVYVLVCMLICRCVCI